MDTILELNFGAGSRRCIGRNISMIVRHAIPLFFFLPSTWIQLANRFAGDAESAAPVIERLQDRVDAPGQGMAYLQSLVCATGGCHLQFDQTDESMKDISR
jgi:hypothetical protein